MDMVIECYRHAFLGVYRTQEELGGRLFDSSDSWHHGPAVEVPHQGDVADLWCLPQHWGWSLGNTGDGTPKRPTIGASATHLPPSFFSPWTARMRASKCVFLGRTQKILGLAIRNMDLIACEHPMNKGRTSIMGLACCDVIVTRRQYLFGLHWCHEGSITVSREQSFFRFDLDVPVVWVVEPLKPF